MTERRRRIFEATRALMSEKGLDGFSVNAVCARAGVARQTVYRSYRTRDDLIAAAMIDYFERSDSAIPYHSPVGTLNRLIERMVGVGKRNLGVRDYIVALTAFYFDPTSSMELRDTMRSITSLSQRPYIDGLARDRLLHPWVDAEALVTDVDGQRMILVSRWANGEVPDTSLIDLMVKSVLIYLLGCVKDAAYSEIAATLAAIDRIGAVAYVEGQQAGAEAEAGQEE